MISDQIHHHEENNTENLAMVGDFWWDDIANKELPTVASVIHPQLECLEPNIGEFSHDPDLDWAIQPDVPTAGEPHLLQACNEKGTSQQDIRKSLLRLKAELLQDLDLLDDCSNNFPFSHVSDGCNTTIETRHFPIDRLLDHSSWLLDVIHSLRGTADLLKEEYSDLTPSTELSHLQSCQSEGSISQHSDSGDFGSGESVATISSLDSGYQTTTSSPGHQALTSYDITLWLSVLEGHCYLTRIYRAIFTRLYQWFLIIPPTDVDGLLLLPNPQYGQTHLDQNFASQVKILVEVGSTMIGNIELALGLQSACSLAEGENEVHTLAAAIEKDWPSSIRDFVVAQEQGQSEMPLAEIMKCLRQLV